MELNDTLKGLYLQLADFVNEHNKHNDDKNKKLTICPATQGSPDATIMIVGRSINSWCNWTETESSDIITRLNKCVNITLDWVRGENYFTYCINQNCPHQGEDGERSKSKLWQFARKIVDPNKTDDKWTEKIIWSNLYKASYTKGGNPSYELCEQQKGICDKILKEEIITFKPSKIFFLTEVNHKDGSNRRTRLIESDFGETIEYLRQSYQGELYISKRPERRKFDELLEEFIDLDYNVKKWHQD